MIRYCGALAAVALGLFASPAAAQTNHGWVSATGSDSAACTAAAPCRTLNAALGKTNAGGQITCLDHADYGALTIRKAITIDCDRGMVRGGQVPLYVSVGAADAVHVRGLTVTNANYDQNGIYLQGGILFLDRVTVTGFQYSGIHVEAAIASQLFVADTLVSGSGRPDDASYNAITVSGANPVAIRVTLARTSLVGNSGSGLGVYLQGGGAAVTLAVTDSVISGNQSGVRVRGANSASSIRIEDSELTGNSIGISSEAGAGSAIVGDSVVTGNNAGIVPVSGGSILTAGGNTVYGNAGGNQFTGAVTQ